MRQSPLVADQSYRGDFPVFPDRRVYRRSVEHVCLHVRIFRLRGKSWRRATSLIFQKISGVGRTKFRVKRTRSYGSTISIYGDVFDWLRHWRKRSRLRPNNSGSADLPQPRRAARSGRAGRLWPVARQAALPVLRPGGVLFFLASTNAAHRTGAGKILGNPGWTQSSPRAEEY